MSKTDASSVFAVRLKAARLAAGLTQEALGIQAGIPEDVARTRVNRYERAVHDADQATAQKLAAALGLPLAALYAENELMARVIKAFAKLTLQDQRKFLKELERQAEAKL